MAPDNGTITADEFAPLIGTPDCPMVVDVCRREAFDAATRVIAGAKWRSHRAIDDWAATLPEHRDIVVNCLHGHQMSQSTVARLRALGHRARYLEGGIDAFLAAGGTTIEKSPTLPNSTETTTRWITRARPKIDRMACPWLIRRFIDRDAEFLFVSSDWVRESAVEQGAIPFDIPDTTFSHVGDACSFDAFLKAFAIKDRALHHLALIVRGADTARLDLAPQAAGLLAMSLGISASETDDHSALERGMVLYDALYAWARHAVDEKHNWTPDTPQQ